MALSIPTEIWDNDHLLVHALNATTWTPAGVGRQTIIAIFDDDEYDDDDYHGDDDDDNHYHHHNIEGYW